LFTKFIYDEKPNATPQDILDTYNLNLIYITTTKNIKPDVIHHVRKIQEHVNQAKSLKTIGDSLLNIRRLRAKKRVNITDDTQEDFQTARINDRMNQESDIYANWNSEVDKQVHLDNRKSQATKTDNEESRDHIYNDLEISDLPRLSEADDSEELLNSSLLDTKD
ncbi:2457_t:CDS:2, partial [Dentiscutata heterogama]